MTREEEIREAIDKTFPCTDGGRCYEQAIGASGFELGVKWADNRPKSPWISVKDKLPPEGVEVIAYHHKWVDEDFNPNGTRIGFLDGNRQFTSAFWWDSQDCYETINKSYCGDNEDFYKNHIDSTEPEYWCYIPNPPKQ